MLLYATFVLVCVVSELRRDKKKLTSRSSLDTEVANASTINPANLFIWCLCFFCVCEQEVATVAAEAAPAPGAPSVTAPDSEPDEPKDTEMEEPVSHC